MGLSKDCWVCGEPAIGLEVEEEDADGEEQGEEGYTICMPIGCDAALGLCWKGILS